MTKKIFFEEFASRQECEAWARANYKTFEPIAGVWHPMVQAECVRMNIEAGCEILILSVTDVVQVERILSEKFADVMNILEKGLGQAEPFSVTTPITEG